jgi:hypothetical protein
MIIKSKSSQFISIGILLLFMAYHQSYASDASEKAEVDAVMTKAAKQANEQTSGMKVDEYTRIRFVGFDKNVPVFMYLYSTSIGTDKLNAEQKMAMDVFHINKTCGSNFRPLMKNPYNLKVSHEFEDIRTGKTIYKITVVSKDCS